MLRICVYILIFSLNMYLVILQSVMEAMEIHHTTVHELSLLRDYVKWWNITCIRVIHIWKDDDDKRWLLWLIDVKVSKNLPLNSIKI